MRQYLGVVIGALVGAAGGVLFMQSMPPAEGPQAARAEQAEKKLRRAESLNRELVAAGGRAGPRRTAEDGARDILDDIKAGRDVDLDDIFKVTKPWLQDFSPLLNRIRVRAQTEEFDRMAGNLSKEYNLSERQEKALRQWLEEKAEQNAAEWEALVDSDSSTLVDLFRAGRDADQSLSGIDSFMESQLSGDSLARFQDDRRVERIENVQHEANGKLNRLDALVDLDPGQENQLFLLMTRGSRDYVPTMEIEGMTGDRTPITPESRTDAIRAVLRPDQLEVFEADRLEQRREAEEDLREIGLKLPDNWDLMDEYDW
jgi:hypothetical protein